MEYCAWSVPHSSLHGHTGSVDHIALCGRTLVSAGSDWSVCWYHKHHFMHIIGNVKCTSINRSIPCMWYQEHTVAHIHVYAPGSINTTCIYGPHSCVRVWDIHTGKLNHSLTGHTEEIEVLYSIHVIQFMLLSDCSIIKGNEKVNTV